MRDRNYFADVDGQTGQSANKQIVVYLTLLGGGVFGNRDDWIIAAIERACRKHAQHDLDVRIVSDSRSKPVVAQLVSHLNRI